jgi:hypothetical protein
MALTTGILGVSFLHIETPGRQGSHPHVLADSGIFLTSRQTITCPQHSPEGGEQRRLKPSQNATRMNFMASVEAPGAGTGGTGGRLTRGQRQA